MTNAHECCLGKTKEIHKALESLLRGVEDRARQRQEPHTGAQLRIFKGRGLINKKVHTKLFLKRIYPEIIFFRFRNKGNRTGSFRTSMFSYATKKL